jgi:hypothetical protein
MKYTLKGWLVKNNLITGKPNDRLLRLDSNGTLTLNNLIDLMEKEHTGLRRETLEHAVKLFNRVVTEQIMKGYAVNTELFHAAPQILGVIEKGQWNPEKNAIHVVFTEDKEIRQAIADTTIQILGEKSHVMYISAVKDARTGATNGTATPGSNFFIYGRMLKIAGNHEAVGITLTDTSGQVTHIAPDMLAINNPSQLLIVLPAHLPQGEYMLTINTQYSGTSTLLKIIRTTEKVITLRPADTTTIDQLT